MEFCCNSIWINIVIFLIGTAILVKGSDVFVDAAANIARKWHVSELVIGLTLVSIGTSVPELATSIFSQAGGCDDGDFVIGNIMGSNVTNITLILGAAVALGGAMGFPKKLFTRDVIGMNVLFIVTVLMFFICPKIPALDGTHEVLCLNRICGILLLAGAAGYTYLLFRSGEVESGGGSDENMLARISLPKEFLLLILGLSMISSGSKAMVDTVQWSAKAMGVSTMMISATIVAFGTSVPELAVTIAGVIKKKYEMAIGNIVGSCVFNILLILGVCALIRPLGLASGEKGVVNILMMIPAGLLLLFAMGIGFKKERMERWTGFLLLLAYAGFLAYNICSMEQ